MKITNETDYVVDRLVAQDAQGQDLLLVVAKATFALNGQEDARLTLADEQLPLAMADAFFDEPDNSSIRYSSDVSWGKSATDMALIGDAVAPDERTTQMEVVFRVH